MNEKLFPERLKELRIEKGITLEELAKNIGTTKTTLSRYENGERSPKLQLVGLLANYFQVDMAWLSGQSIYKNTLDVLPVYNQLTPSRQQKVYDFAENQLKEQEQEIKRENNPITSLEQFRKKKEEETVYGTTKWYGAVSAGTGEFLTDETCEEIELPIEQIPDEADFCLSVNGDSMEPIFHDNDYVFVKRQSEIFSGNIGVVIVNGESFLKRIWFENNNIRLESFNKKYKDIIITENDEFRIVGKVVM
ncbi:helix-turn-helix domain-containing protein [Enterococcus faecalis]|uniref:helix-turn-helix domain-containing protein n=1 Tax=Enterococcus faecalis TaxID=1351 RepID=UPI000FFE57FB|nr:S24 family peptidase [Enterococcus faecalis]MDN3093771.1 S24 family peptidase [Enterococcus faecalis]RXF35998.1 helix-turn-helix domain-containing protein [Enterococcus faecalis]HBC7247196.1 helix-turn-helix domain-containing protein [Enterococcus faecalis]